MSSEDKDHAWLNVLLEREDGRSDKPDVRRDLWKHFQDKIDTIRGRLWTVGTWHITLLAALFVVAHEFEVFRLIETFPGAVVVMPFPALLVAVTGLAICANAFSAIADHVHHIQSNTGNSSFVTGSRYDPKSRLFGGAWVSLYLVSALFTLGYLVLLLLSLFAFCGSASGKQPAAAAAAARGERHVTLLTINDVYRIGGVEGGRAGLARVRALRKELESEDPDLLVLHAGDFLYPSLISRLFDGAQMVDVLNALDGHPFAFDPRFFVVFGNHEFDKKKYEQASILAARVEELQFTWLKSNLTFAKDATGRPLVGGPRLNDTALVEANGIKVGLFGITTDVSKPGYVERFEGRLGVAERLTAELRRAGAEVVIALTHQTVEHDLEVLGGLGRQGPDLIIGGHEHVRQSEMDGDGRRLLKADADAVSALVVRVALQPEGPPKVTYEYRNLEHDTPAPDPEVAALVARLESLHEIAFCAKEDLSQGCLREEVGTATTVLVAEEEKIRSCESGFGNWIADRAREAFEGADAAIINAGGLRLNQNIAPGPIRLEHLYELVEYDDEPLQLIEVDAGILQQVVDNAIKGWPGNGRWLQVSGLTFRHDRSDDSSPKATGLALLGPDGSRIQLEPGNTVKLVVPHYLIDENGDQDGYTFLKPSQKVAGASEAVHLRKLLIDSVQKAGSSGIRPPQQNRIDESTVPECPEPAGSQ